MWLLCFIRYLNNAFGWHLPYFFHVSPHFHEELQINQTPLQEWLILYSGYSPVSNVRFPVAHIQVPSVWCVCCNSVFSLQMNCIHLHVFVTSTVWQVVLSFPFPLPPIQVRISNNHHWLVWCPDSRPDQTRPGINNWQSQYFAWLTLGLVSFYIAPHSGENIQ